MINLEHAIWDIQHIRRRLGDENELNIRFLINLIGQYRAEMIVRWNDKMRNIQSEWVQKFYDETPTYVGLGDLTAIANPTITVPPTRFFYKFKFPSTLSGMNGNFGVVRIYSANGITRFYETTRDILELMIQALDPNLTTFVWFFKEGDSFYFYNPAGTTGVNINIGADLILSDPFQGYIWRTEGFSSSFELEPGEEYRVSTGYPKEGAIDTPLANALQYNGKTYAVNETFIAEKDVPPPTPLIAESVVSYVNKKKMLTIKDPYPLDAGSLQEIIMLILTKDLQLEAQSVQDVIGDSADTLNLLKQNRS